MAQIEQMKSALMSEFSIDENDIIKSKVVGECLIMLVHDYYTVNGVDMINQMSYIIAPIDYVKSKETLNDFMLPEDCGRDVNSPWGIFGAEEEDGYEAGTTFDSLAADAMGAL